MEKGWAQGRAQQPTGQGITTLQLLGHDTAEEKNWYDTAQMTLAQMQA